MKIFVTSDTHMCHNKLIIPQCDIMIHCGDFTNKHNPYENELEARNFLEWYKVLPIKNKILISGNHDASCFKGLVKREEYPELIWLEHETANIEGLNIFGSPYSPIYGNWYYTYKRGRSKTYWDSIPDNIDIIAVHTMPKGCLDLTKDLDDNLIQVGCKGLLNRVLEVKPKIGFFGGHLHNEKDITNFGMVSKQGVKIYNCSMINHHKPEEFNQGHLIFI
jgi:Icc-related predicted phosphoesterase